MFSGNTLKQLNLMRVDSDDYFRNLVDKFGADVKYFDELINKFSKVTEEDRALFMDYCNSHNIDSDSLLLDHLYEAFNNLISFNSGGVLSLFKFKSAESGAPRVNIRKEDLASYGDIDMLSEKTIIYRGMSKQEYESKKFTQHWSTDPNKAKEFAEDIYTDAPDGIVVKAVINKEDVIHYDSFGSEKELIPIISKLENIEVVSI